jgi:hypothetical protein
MPWKWNNEEVPLYRILVTLIMVFLKAIVGWLVVVYLYSGISVVGVNQFQFNIDLPLFIVVMISCLLIFTLGLIPHVRVFKTNRDSRKIMEILFIQLIGGIILIIALISGSISTILDTIRVLAIIGAIYLSIAPIVMLIVFMIIVIGFLYMRFMHSTKTIIVMSSH